MSQPAPHCPVCGSTDLLFNDRRQEYVCEDCAHRWSLPAPGPALDWPAGLSPGDLPTYLAAPLAALLAEPNPRVRLHWLVDCAEIAVRWSVAVTLAQVVQAHAGTLPEPLVRRLRAHIERPTLGRWLGMLAALSHPRPATGLPAPGFFDLYAGAFAPRFRPEGHGGTLDTSLLLLRNQLAHGAGLPTTAARSLLETHQLGVFALLRAVAQAGQGTQVIALTGAQAVRLAGPRPCPIPRPPELRDGTDGPWLITASGVLPLMPLAAFGPVRLVDGAGRVAERPGDPAAQLYLRAGRDRLAYVPLGRDEAVSLTFDLDAFRALFRLDDGLVTHGRSGADGRWDDFRREARILAEDLVGRAAELGVLRDWLKGRDTREAGTAGIALITGAPGVGKSLLMARLATDLGNARPERQALYYHRFRGGDARNSTRAFLRGLLAALGDWELLPAAPTTAEDPGDQLEDLLEAVRARLDAVAALAPPRTKAPAPRFLVLADGLDEVLPQDPRLPHWLRELALPGTLWLLASRPEPALDHAFSGPDCAHLFPQGLPPLSAPDLRAMLLEGLAGARQSLIARDEDSPQGVHNPFVERVVACAAGLPLYVHLLLEDLRGGRLTVHDEDRLPRGLVAYYDTLMAGIGLADLKRDLPLLIACLARAEEPLDPAALALLLADVPAEAPDYIERARQAVRAGRVLLRDAPTADGTAGLTLYHQSFRDYVGGVPARGGRPATPPAPALAGTVRDAERKFCRLAVGWAGLPPGNLRQHLFRWGVRYALRWQGAAGLEAARQRLTDFAFLQAYTAELPGSAIRGLVADYETVLARLPEGSGRQTFRLWEAFFREREHILRRGDERWPAHKILLQLAVEHADDSPVTRAAEDWLGAGHCDWVWLRNPRRVTRAVPDPCLRVLEGHTDSVGGALELCDGRILSWSNDCTLRLWDGQNGTPLTILSGHKDVVKGVLALSYGRVLSWSFDKTMRLWDGMQGAQLSILTGQEEVVIGALALPDGRILSWSLNGTLRLWDGQSGASLAVLAEHKDMVTGAVSLSDGHILSWSKDKTLRLWDGQSGAPLATLAGHQDSVIGALAFSDGRILSWSNDKTLRLWDGPTGSLIAIIAGHTDPVTGVRLLSCGSILTWSRGAKDNNLCIWDGQSGASIAILSGHKASVIGALELSDGRILSWSLDRTLRLWDRWSGAQVATLAGHNEGVEGALELSDGRILSWSGPSWSPLFYSESLRLWDVQSGAPLATLTKNTGSIIGAMEMSDGRILSWSADGTLRLWDFRYKSTFTAIEGHTADIYFVLPVAEGRILSSSRDNTLRLWDIQSGVSLATLEGHKDVCNTFRALELSDGRILSWGDQTLRLWDGRSGTPIAIFEGHTDNILGAWEMSDMRVISWSSDKTLRLWDVQNVAHLATLEGHTEYILGAIELSGGRVLSWSMDLTLRLWDVDSGTQIAILKGHTGWVEGAVTLRDGRILSWSSSTRSSPRSGDYTLRLWDGNSGTPLAILAGHSARIRGALELSDGRILSWSHDKTLRLWDGISGAPLVTLAGHNNGIKAAMELSYGRILSWSENDSFSKRVSWSNGDYTLRLWDGQSGQPLSVLIRQSDLPWDVPQLLLHRLTVDSPQRISGQSVAWAYRNKAGIASCIGQTGPACWHGQTAVKSHVLSPEGILVVSLESGHVFCLQLYRGARRITLEDYESELPSC